MPMKRLLLIFTLFTTLVSFSKATELSWPVLETIQLNKRANETTFGGWDYECQSQRAPDYYGIGVRLGIYLSWLTAWLANVAVPRQVSNAIDQNSIFLFANVIALVRCTITFMVTQLDCLVLMHLCGGTIFSVLSIWGYRTCHYKIEGPKGIRHFGGFGTHMRLLLALAVSIYGIWFWYIGILPDNQDLMKIDGPCLTVYTFMFARVRADGGIRIFYIFVCICCTIYFGTMLLVSSIGGWARLTKIWQLVQEHKWRTSSRLHYATGFNYKQLLWIFNFLRFANLLFIIYSILLIELTLNYNHVRAVLGPGGRIYFPSQIIPLIIGAFSFGRMIYKCFEKFRDPEDEPNSEKGMINSGKMQQKFPSGHQIIKRLSPPTTLWHAMADREVVPEDNDIDPLMEDEHPLVRYLISWLPWLSLLPKWQRKAKLLKEEGNRPRSLRRDVERGGYHSETTTLQGSPRATTHAEAEETKEWKSNNGDDVTHMMNDNGWRGLFRQNVDVVS